MSSPDNRSRPRWRGRRGGDIPTRLSESLGMVSEQLGMAGPDVLGAIFGRWEQVVGPSMAAHVRPLRLQDDTLVVAVDHPAWATQVRHLTPEILAKLADACGPSGAPEHLEVRVRA